MTSRDPEDAVRQYGRLSYRHLGLWSSLYSFPFPCLFVCYLY